MKSDSDFTQGLPKTNFRFFYRTDDGQIITCDEERVNALTRIAIKVASNTFKHVIAPEIEVISFLPNLEVKPKNSLFLQFPFTKAAFIIYIKADGFKERIRLTGYIDLFLSEVSIRRSGSKKSIKKSKVYSSSTVVEDVANLLLQAISEKLSSIARSISA